MFSTITVPDAINSSHSPSAQESKHTRTMVILHPLPIYAEAIKSVVQGYSRWRVVGATTDLDEAITMSAAADMIIFDTRWGTVAELARVARRLRESRRGLSLVLLTRHDGSPFLRHAAEADIDAVVHMSESVVTVRAALEAVESGRVGNRRREPALQPLPD